MTFRFTKMHGLGNDFVVFDVDGIDALPDRAFLRTLSDRHTGVGFDQALAILPSPADGVTAAYRIYNADGGEVEQCGNGVRCVAALLAARHGLQGERLRLECLAGPVDAVVRADGLVSVAMGVPNFDTAALPSTLPYAPQQSLDVAGQTVRFGAVSMGNPHAVLTVEEIDTAPVTVLGPLLEHHAVFPQRCNIGFMEIRSRQHIRLRVWERGVGETRACGTGACAAMAVGRHLGWLDEDVTVDLPGGALTIRWAGPGDTLWMTGPAVRVYEGMLTP